MNHHDSKPKEEWSQSLIKRQVRRADQALFPTLAHSFVACGRARVPHAPACEIPCHGGKGGEGGKGGGGEPLAQGLTHTDRRDRRFFQKSAASILVVSFLDIEPH